MEQTTDVNLEDKMLVQELRVKAIQINQKTGPIVLTVAIAFMRRVRGNMDLVVKEETEVPFR